MKEQILIESMSASEGNIITELHGSPGSSHSNIPVIKTGPEVKGNGVFLHGIFMQAVDKNRNGRIYPLEEMQAAVKSMNEQITQYGGVFGELDHPADRLSIALDRVSHAITELELHGNHVIGKAKLLDTPMGLIGKELARSGVRYGVSSRGAGNVNESGIVSGFRCITIDLVATPSAHKALPETMYESLQNYKAGKIITLAESVREDKEAQKYLTKSVINFIRDVLDKK